MSRKSSYRIARGCEIPRRRWRPHRQSGEGSPPTPQPEPLRHLL